MAKKETIKYDVDAMSFERKGHVFKVTVLKDVENPPLIVKQLCLYAAQKKAVDAIASMGGSEYTDTERQDVMQNVVNAINDGQWNVRSERKDTVSKATFQKVYNVAELKVLFKIAPQVLTAEQKSILEYADTLEKDAYLEAHPELMEILDQIEI